jgi:hypothetical protein
LSVGLGIIIIISALISFVEIDKKGWYQPLKGFTTLLFVTSSIVFFATKDHNVKLDSTDSGWDHLSQIQFSFCYLMGIYAFSFSQPVQTPQMIKNRD